MTILELVARTFSPQLQDGRFVFRPWGARGPCYVLSHRQRAARAWIQLVFYVLAIATFAILPDIAASASGLAIYFVGFALVNYVLFWLFSIGLPHTDRPPKQSNEQRHAALAAHSRALGRPTLWIFSIGSWLLALTGGAIALVLREWATGLPVLVFFGACAALFTWQLWLVRGQSSNA